MPSDLKANQTTMVGDPQAIGLWDAALAQLSEWDPAWAAACAKMSTNPRNNGVLPHRVIELAGVAMNAACTSLDPEGTRRHIRAALAAGATRDEIRMILKMASLLAIHSCSLGAPMLLEEAKAAGVQPASRPAAPTPACDKVRALGQWNVAWDPFVELDAVWTDEFMATGAAIYAGGVFSMKEIELLSIAFDASYTHMHAPGTRRHIKGALQAGATLEEIMEVLKLCVVQGIQACNLGVPILAAELERNRRRPSSNRRTKFGGAQGPGKSIAEVMAKEGASIVICDINPQTLASATVIGIRSPRHPRESGDPCGLGPRFRGDDGWHRPFQSR